MLPPEPMGILKSDRVFDIDGDVVNVETVESVLSFPSRPFHDHDVVDSIRPLPPCSPYFVVDVKEAVSH